MLPQRCLEKQENWSKEEWQRKKGNRGIKKTFFFVYRKQYKKRRHDQYKKEKLLDEVKSRRLKKKIRRIEDFRKTKSVVKKN